jgi:hypothetical protein
MNDKLILRHVAEALKSYLGDPASSDYQRGYLACLLTIQGFAAEQNFTLEGHKALLDQLQQGNF